MRAPSRSQINQVFVALSSVPPNRTLRRSACRLATVVAILLSCVLVAAPASSAPAGAFGAVAQPRLYAGGYRAGTAASVFGPSTAIGDFDADGQPDFAIADRIANSSGADYRIEVRLSNGAPQVIRFASSQRTLTVTAVDVDHDNDLDLVFTPVVGRRIIGVWLNDGSGHFKRDTASAVPRELGRLVILSVPRVFGGALPATVSHRRVPVVRPPPSPSDAPILSVLSPIREFGGSRSVRLSRPDAPRGPPVLI